MRIRQGNDFIFLWAIERNGLPEDLSNAVNIRLHFKNFDCVGNVQSFQIVDGNIVRVEVEPKWASRLGAYRLILSYEFEDQSYSDGDRKCVVDVLAFNIVPKTSEADDVTEMAKTTDIMIGLKGDKGDPFTYDDFTPEQIEDLKRPAIEAAESVQIVENQISINEQGRFQAENERETAETIRVSNENNRVTAEQEREDAESLRVTAETSRQTAESLRVEAELLRQTSTQQAISNAESATENANTAAQNANDARLAIQDDLARIAGDVTNFQNTVNNSLTQITAEKQVFESEAAEIKDAVANMSTMGHIYDTLSQAKAEISKPEDGTPFSVMGDGNNDGYYKFDSTQTDGVKFGRKFDRRIQVESISQLRNYKGRPGEAVDVLGYYESGDGGGGTFFWDAASTDTEDGGAIIQATGITIGRWKRRIERTVNIKYFGARGNGVVNDHPAIKSAVDFVVSNGGGELYAPAGNYIVESGIKWQTNLSLKGDGIGKTIFSARGTGFSIIYNVDGASDGTSDEYLENCFFRDFELDGSGFTDTQSAASQKGMFILYMKNARFENLYIHDTIGTGLGCDFLIETVISNVITRNCGRLYELGPSKIGQSGIGIGTNSTDIENIVIENCFCYNNGNYGIFVESQNGSVGNGIKSKYAKIIDCYVEGNRIGIGNKGSGGVEIVNCHSIGNYIYGIQLSQGPREDSIRNCIVENNIDSGIFVEYTHLGHLHITGNKIRNNGGRGVVLPATSGGITLTKDVVISDNIIGDNYYSGVQLSEIDSLTFSGNIIFNNGQGSASQNNYGLRLEKLNRNLVLTGNVFYDNQEVVTQVAHVTILIADIDGFVLVGNIFKNGIALNQNSQAVIENQVVSNNTGLGSDAAPSIPFRSIVSTNARPLDLKAIDANRKIILTGLNRIFNIVDSLKTGQSAQVEFRGGGIHSITHAVDITVISKHNLNAIHKGSNVFIEKTGELEYSIYGDINSGYLQNRPTENLTTGMLHFDSTLGRPIWWNGAGWVDATGTIV